MAYATINKPTDYFNTKTYSGNSSTQAITGVGFQPDWVWLKRRDQTAWHYLTDAVRGVQKTIFSNDTSAEVTKGTGLTAFNSDGFTLGSEGDVNESGGTYVGWNWLASNTTTSNTDGSITSTVSANTSAGFSIVSYTGTGSSSTTGHGLNSAPEIMISKSRTAVQNWSVHTTIIDGSLDYLVLNDTSAKADSSFTAPTSTVIPTRTGSDYISYNFHSVKGYSKFGSYTGNGNADGPVIYTGFKPAMIIFKNTTGEFWNIFDNKRDPSNQVDAKLYPNGNNAEASTSQLDFLSNGFKLRNTEPEFNQSGTEIIYMAFAESPLVGTNNIPATAR